MSSIIIGHVLRKCTQGFLRCLVKTRQTEAMYISAESKTGDVLTEAKTLVVFAREMCGSGQTDGNERSCDANAQLPGEHPARDVAPVDLRDVQAQSGAVH